MLWFLFEHEVIKQMDIIKVCRDFFLFVFCWLNGSEDYRCNYIRVRVRGLVFVFCAGCLLLLLFVLSLRTNFLFRLPGSGVGVFGFRGIQVAALVVMDKFPSVDACFAAQMASHRWLHTGCFLVV